MPDASLTVKLVLADRGAFHVETVQVPGAALERYARLVDLLLEEPEVTRRLALDPARLVCAYLVEEAG